jgi:hypothetical protein
LFFSKKTTNFASISIYAYTSMGKKSKIILQANLIEKDIGNYGVRSFTKVMLYNFFLKHEFKWELPKTTTASRFVDVLVRNQLLIKTQIQVNDEQFRTLYTWKSNDVWTILQGIKKDGYFSHFSAVVLHDLTNQNPKTFYFNNERKSNDLFNKSPNSLTQSAIDKAFLKEQRKTDAIYKFNSQKLLLINGKNTGRIGVIKKETSSTVFYYTDLERTLIDIAVRPAYAGGVFDVLDAYKKAKGLADISRLASYLLQMKYVYPYHQIIGFYLEKAGYPEKDIKKLEHQINFDFYLTYAIKKTEYSIRWRLFYPKGL